jgi:hypothetical protein
VEFADLADAPTGCGKAVSGGCIFASKFIVTKSHLFTEADRRARPTMMLPLC